MVAKAGPGEMTRAAGRPVPGADAGAGDQPSLTDGFVATDQPRGSADRWAGTPTPAVAGGTPVRVALLTGTWSTWPEWCSGGRAGEAADHFQYLCYSDIRCSTPAAA